MTLPEVVRDIDVLTDVRTAIRREMPITRSEIEWLCDEVERSKKVSDRLFDQETKLLDLIESIKNSLEENARIKVEETLKSLGLLPESSGVEVEEIQQ